MKENHFSRRGFIRASALAAISVSPVIDTLSQVLGTDGKQAKLLVDCAFRLADWKNLLNLEFYFIGVDYRDNGLFRRRKLLARYGQQESYMIVRLPQQHIAEQAFAVPDGGAGPDDGWTAVTMISGYSYLVFRLVFAEGKDRVKVPLTPGALMDWNNDRRFKLVVRQNLTDSLFEIQLNHKDNVENVYPFGYKPMDGGKFAYSYDRFPKAYGDPVTALEFPWRLVLSPKLPDQDRFRWRWDFSLPPRKLSGGKLEAELWTASLSLTENPEYQRLLELRKARAKKKVAAGDGPDAGAEEREAMLDGVEDVVRKIELMILGSPDFPDATAVDGVFLNNADGTRNAKWEVLPKAEHRRKLVELYIRYKLVARSEKLMFSPLGVSTFMELKNTKIDDTLAAVPANNLWSWKQLISFGRDEEVEVVELVIDKEFGHKWLHLFTTKRRTRKGTSYLDYREYIMPLEIDKDYSGHQNMPLRDIVDNTSYTASKFASPFRKIEVLEKAPKRVLGLKAMADSLEKFGTDGFAYIPQVFEKNVEGKHDFVEFQYRGTDWQGQQVVFRKKIQAIQATVFKFVNEVVASPALRKAEVLRIEKLFGSDQLGRIEKLERDIQAFSGDYRKVVAVLREVESEQYRPVEELARFRGLLSETRFYREVGRELPLLNAAVLDGVKEFHNLLESSKTMLSAAQLQVLKAKADAVKTLVAAKRDVVDITDAALDKAFRELEDQIDQLPNGFLYTIFFSVLHRFSFRTLRNTKVLVFDGVNYELRKLVKLKVADEWLRIQAEQRRIPNLIRTYRQKIGYAVPDLKSLEQAARDGLRDEVSNLETDFLVFRGELKRDLEMKLDFFDTYASLPQLKQARAYVKSLDKIVNEEVPIALRYAQDYLDSQLDLARMEVERNASRVFMEVTAMSRDYLKGKIRQVAADMGGYINPEIPVEFLTYLKDPKQVPEKLKGELLKQFPELSGQAGALQQGYDDMVFIGQAAKEQWNKLRRIEPKEFFAGLDAKILGSIPLKDILGLDFELPRLSEFHDRVVYNFQTDRIRDVEVADTLRFYGRNRGRRASLQVYLEKQLRNPTAYRSFTRLSDFALAIKLGSVEVLMVLFNKMEVSASQDRAKRTEVKIDDVVFGGPLDFVGKIAEAIKLPGTGLRVEPSLSGVSIGYAFALPSIETPAFNLANLKFDVGLQIPFPTKETVAPMLTTFSINRPNDKFLVSVGIFGGRGHFVLAATPEKIESIDASIEFGGYFGINLGIAAGHVYLFAGIRYQMGSTGLVLTGYVICGGGVTVFGFISVSVTFLLAMTYQRSGGQATLFGSASVRYSVKIGFFKKSFTLRYSKRLYGAKGKRVDPAAGGDMAYVGAAEPVYYASLDGEVLVPEVSENGTGGSGEVKVVEDQRNFRSIYPENSGLWDQYCKAFNFD